MKYSYVAQIEAATDKKFHYLDTEQAVLYTWI